MGISSIENWRRITFDLVMSYEKKGPEYYHRALPKRHPTNAGRLGDIFYILWCREKDEIMAISMKIWGASSWFIAQIWKEGGA